MSEITMAAVKFAQGLRETADYLNDAVFSDDIAAMRDALELGRNKLRQAAEALEETEREWDLFELITSVYHGKQYYFRQDDGTVYSRDSGLLLSFDQAIDEFCGRLSNG